MSPNTLITIVLVLMVLNWFIYYWSYRPIMSLSNYGIDKPWYEDMFDIITLGGKLDPRNMFPFYYIFPKKDEMPLEKPLEVPLETPSIQTKVELDQDNQIVNETPKEEVFNIDENEFNYSEARAVCKAFGAKLATYGQVIDAHKQGANWCNYGWSENQMALFPIQENYWKMAQLNPELKDTCGKPGVNGGYFDDTNLKFGVNCYGIKPKPDESKIVYTDSNELDVLDTEKMILDKYKEKISSGEIEPRPFSSSLWSQHSHKKSVYYLTPNSKNTIEITKGPNEEDKLNVTKVDNLKNNIFTSDQLNLNVL